MGAAPATQETILVLSLTGGGATQLDHAPEFQSPDGARPTTRHFLSRYYDTVSSDLAQAGFSLRVTRSGNNILQTLETTQASGLSMQRCEWEWPLLNDQPDLSLLPVLTPKPLPPSGLREIFVADLKRVVRTLHPAPGATIRASFDEGTLDAAAASEPVRDLALEALSGEPDTIYRFASHLHARIPFAITLDSLATRGLRLASGNLPASEKPAPIALPATASGAASFRLLAAECLHHLVANQPAALGGSLEGVHQMRVAIRRLRALLLLYKKVLDPRRFAQFDRNLQQIGSVFGQARDWDVFCAELLPEASRPPAPADLYDGLKSAAADRRHDAHDAFNMECGGHRFAATILDLAAWTEEGQDKPDRLGRAKLTRALQDLAPRWLDRLARRVEARGQNIARANDTALHQLRKSIKKLRYGIEFTDRLFAREKSRLYQKRCKALQDTLGRINDSSTSVQLARTLQRSTEIDLRPAISALARHQKKQRQNGLDELAKSWKAYRRKARFW